MFKMSMNGARSPSYEPISFPFSEHREGTVNTNYLGENAREEIIWSYNHICSKNYSSSDIIELLNGKTRTMTGRVVGHDARSGRLYCRLPDNQYLTVADDHTFETTPTNIPTNITKLIVNNDRLLCLGYKSLAVANDVFQHPQELLATSETIVRAKLLNEQQLFIYQTRWELFDLEYSTVVYRVACEEQTRMAAVLKPNLLAFNALGKTT